jgi:hypothetical protein
MGVPRAGRFPGTSGGNRPVRGSPKGLRSPVDPYSGQEPVFPLVVGAASTDRPTQGFRIVAEELTAARMSLVGWFVP